MDIEVDLELEIKILCRELRLLLLHEFRLGRKATEATCNICSTMGKDTLSIRTAQYCFHRFKNSNFELDDLPHTGRLSEVDMDHLKQLIGEDPRLTSQCFKRTAWMLPQSPAAKIKLKKGNHIARS